MPKPDAKCLEEGSDVCVVGLSKAVPAGQGIFRHPRVNLSATSFSLFHASLLTLDAEWTRRWLCEDCLLIV